MENEKVLPVVMPLIDGWHGVDLITDRDITDGIIEACFSRDYVPLLQAAFKNDTQVLFRMDYRQRRYEAECKVWELQTGEDEVKASLRSPLIFMSDKPSGQQSATGPRTLRPDPVFKFAFDEI